MSGCTSRHCSTGWDQDPSGLQSTSNFPFVPGTQSSGLYPSNFVMARTDEQIGNTCKARDIALLESAAAQAY